MDAQVAYFYAALSQLDTMVSLIEVKEFRRGVGAGAVGGARTLLWVFSFVFVLPMVLVSVFLK